MTPETVLMTGTSSGIGKALARCSAAKGSGLVFLGRSGGALESLADELRKTRRVDVRVLAAGLAQPDLAHWAGVIYRDL